MEFEAMGLVADPTQIAATDTSDYQLLLGRQADLLISQFHGQHYTQTFRKKLFWGSSASAGAAIPAAGATAITNHILWNKAGSTVNAVPVALMLGWVGTTEAPGNMQYSFLAGAGSAIGTAAPISAFTAATPQNGFLSGPGPSTGMAFGTAATLTGAGTLLGTLGLNHLTTTGTATFGSFTAMYIFNGTLIVPPGVAIYPTASAATASTYTGTLIWYESPI